MNKKEQIIHALYTQKVIGNIDLMELLEKAGYKDYSISAIIDRITDAILALPLDVPSDKEIEEQFPLIDYGFCTDIERVNIGYINSKRVNIQFGMKRMRDEIIKRNRVI